MKTVDQIIFEVFSEEGIVPSVSQQQADMLDPAIIFAGRIEFSDEEADQVKHVFKELLKLPREQLEGMLRAAHGRAAARAAVN